jgi:hypothetical protein
VFAQRFLFFTLNKSDDCLTGSIGGNEGYLSGIPDSFCDRRLVRHLFGTFIETDACACVMDSVSVRSCILVSGTSLTRVSLSVLSSQVRFVFFRGHLELWCGISLIACIIGYLPTVDKEFNAVIVIVTLLSLRLYS